MGGNVILSYVDDCVYWYTSEALRKNCGHSREKITRELPGICTLVYVNQDFPDEGPLYFSGS